MAKIVTMGEIMLRLSTPGHKRFVQTDTFEANYGGGEANVAVSLAHYGHEAYFVSKVPRHEIGQAAVNSLRRYGVRVDHVARGGERLGVYYLETGANVRPSKVIYDRAGSSMSRARPGDFDFGAIFSGVDWFHWTGITPALGEDAAECLRLAMEAARAAGVTVSCDLNYRSKLWSPERARSVMRPLMSGVDVCVGNEEDARLCLGIEPEADVERGDTPAEGYKGAFRRMSEEFGFRHVVGTLRESYSATRNGWKALAYDGTEFSESRRYELDPIVDRVGGGDSFCAGLIHGLVSGMGQAGALEFAAAAGALKHTVPGDVSLAQEDEVKALAAGHSNGRVQR